MKTPSKPEALVLCGIALIILSIVLPSAWAVRIHRRAEAVRAELYVLADALARFEEEYGAWPTRRGCGHGDCHFGWAVPNREVINALRAVAGPGNEDDAINPNRFVFLSPLPLAQGRSGVDGEGEYRDPWGTPFQIVLDTDLNNECAAETTVHRSGPGTGFVVWSCGPDRKSDTEDDIVP